MQMHNCSFSRFFARRGSAPGLPASAHAVARASAVLLVAGLSLAACGGEDAAQVRGFSGGAAAAEVRVTSRPPLSLPPDYTRRPERGPDRAADASLAPPAGGRPAVPGSGTVSGPPSTGQSALLSAAGPAAPADIRVKVNEDVQVEMTNRALTDELMSWQRPADQPRLIDNKASKGFLSRIF